MPVLRLCSKMAAGKRKFYIEDSSESDDHNPNKLCKREALIYGVHKYLPEMVSNWTEEDLNGTGIFYKETGCESAHELLDGAYMVTTDHLSEESKSAINYLKRCLQFNIETDASGKFSAAGCVPLTREIADHIDRELDHQKLEIPDESERLRSVQNAFLYAEDLIERIRSLVLHYRKHKNIQEQTYTELLKTFGQMCGLRGEYGGIVKERVTIGRRAVSSIPDIRFKTRGKEPFLKSVEAVVSVAEVKRKSTDETKDPDQSGAKRTEYSENYYIHNISFINRHVLGQHGGALFVDWENSLTNPTIIGMIVYRTKIIFTSLNMKTEDYQEIRDKGKLGKGKKVEIAYCKPLDFFLQEDRKTLYKLFFRMSETNLSRT